MRCSDSSCCFNFLTQLWYRSSSSRDNPLAVMPSWMGNGEARSSNARCDCGTSCMIAGGPVDTGTMERLPAMSSAATSAEYADVWAFSTAPRNDLFVLFAVLMEFSRNWRSSSSASALLFHLSRSFLCFLHNSSNRKASCMNQSSSFSNDWIFASRRVFVSSSSAFCFNSLNSFCTFCMKLLYAKKKAVSFACNFASTLSSRSSASACRSLCNSRILSPPSVAPRSFCRNSAFSVAALLSALSDVRKVLSAATIAIFGDTGVRTNACATARPPLEK
mmetsp:Transcript_122891/g.355217  ORF Transcript_122891/g.355217 Transcript_122891/m.355217 type:complete len:276 (-) Transcript_122891:1-828(-)